MRAEEDFFPALPPRPAVCLIEAREEKAEPFLIRTQNLQRRLQRLLGPVDPASKRLNLSDFARGIRYRLIGSPFEQTLTCYQHAKQLFPKRYRDLMRLRRSAQAFAERVLDLFKVRRCQIKIHRDPTFPGCLYSEMKMCLAPCFAGCTKEEYDVEVQRLVQFLETSGGSLRSTIEEEREKASEQLDFERAAALHKKVEKLDEVLRGRPELTRRIQDLDAVILQRAAEEQTIGVYPVRGGRLAEPFFLRFAEIASQPRSAEHIFREQFESDSPATNADLGEHLWLVARWYYSNPREGEIFFREKDWPYRRILRACSRLLAPQASAEAKPETQGPATNPEGVS